MVGQIAQVHKPETHFATGLLQPPRVLRRTEVVVYRVRVGQLQFRCQHGSYGLQRQVDTVLHGSDDVQVLHGCAVIVSLLFGQ